MNNNNDEQRTVQTRITMLSFAVAHLINRHLAKLGEIDLRSEKVCLAFVPKSLKFRNDILMIDCRSVD